MDWFGEQGKISGVHGIWGTVKEATRTALVPPQEEPPLPRGPFKQTRVPHSWLRRQVLVQAGLHSGEHHHIWSETLGGERGKENKKALNRLKDGKKNA